jgi:hypothetical protein
MQQSNNSVRRTRRGLLVTLAVTAAALISPSLTPKARAYSWVEIYKDYFNSPSSWSNYNRFAGKAGATSNTAFDPSFVWFDTDNEVMNMMVDKQTRTIWDGSTYPYSSSGWSLSGTPTYNGQSVNVKQIYGKWEVRAKMAPGTGVDTYIALFPTNGTWPPEVDFGETPGKNPTKTLLAQHWKNADGTNNKSTSTVTMPVDLCNTFNNYTVEWIPGHIRYFLNGVLKLDQPQNFPNQTMNLTVGTWVGDGGWDFVGTPGQNGAPWPFRTFAYIDHVFIWKYVP